MNIKTLCRDCVFKTTDNNQNQTGCELGRLNRFIELKQAEILPKTETSIDEEPEFYTINRYCNMCRNQTWLKDTLNKNKHPEDRLLEEICPKIAVCLLLDCNDTLDFIKEVLDDILYNENNIDELVVLNNSYFNRPEISNLLDKYLSQTDILWKQVKPVENYSDGIFLLLENLDKINSDYIMLISDNKTKVPENINYKVHRSVNVLLDKWILIHSEDEKVFLTTKVLLNNIVNIEFNENDLKNPEDSNRIDDVNSELNVVRKIKLIAELNQQEFLIKKYDYLEKL